jgi:hypothetical protein
VLPQILMGDIMAEALSGTLRLGHTQVEIPLAASVLAVPHYHAGRASQGFPAIGSVTRPRNGRWHALSVG